MNSSNRTERKEIAIIVLLASALFLVTILGLLVWTGGEDGDSGDAAESAFTSLLPLIGTWIGTVLAYYFSGENFQRATDSVTRIASQVAEERLRSTHVTEAMIPIERATVIRLATDNVDGAKTNLVQDAIEQLSNKITRLPVIDSEGCVQYILHESLVYKFVSDLAVRADHESTQTTQTQDLTLQNLLAHGDNASFASSTISFVPKDAVLSEAKHKMEALRKCQDVFVTEDGSRSSPVIGWITNVIVSRHARA